MILAIDPGTKHTGIVCDSINGVRQFPKVPITTATLRAREWEAVFSILCGMMRDPKVKIIAIEDYEDRPYLKRRVNKSVDMGKMVGSLKTYAESTGKQVLVVGAANSKRNMDFMRGCFPNEHEFSAYCVANWAVGRSKIDRAARR